MTDNTAQSPSPAAMAAVDQIFADARRFVSDMLSQTALPELRQGTPMERLYVILSRGMITTEHAQHVTVGQYRALMIAAVARLANLTHQIETLAGQWARQAPDQSVWDGNCEAAFERHAEMLRELVQDHG